MFVDHTTKLHSQIPNGDSRSDIDLINRVFKLFPPPGNYLLHLLVEIMVLVVEDGR